MATMCGPIGESGDQGLPRLHRCRCCPHHRRQRPARLIPSFLPLFFLSVLYLFTAHRRAHPAGGQLDLTKQKTRVQVPFAWHFIPNQRGPLHYRPHALSRTSLTITSRSPLFLPPLASVVDFSVEGVSFILFL